MSMLHDGGMQGAMVMKEAKHCEPDYGSMINTARSQLKRTKAFKNAALDYFEGRVATGKMAELIGELVTETESYEYRIEKLIQQQEAAAKK